MELHTSRIPLRMCPNCGLASDNATHVRNADVHPLPGSMAICINCGCPGIFQQDLTLRVPSTRELEDFIAKLPPKELRAMSIVLQLTCRKRGFDLSKSGSHGHA